MDPLSIAGLGLTGVKLLGDLFSNPEAERQRRKKEVIESLMRAKGQRISRGLREIGTQTQGMIASASQDAGSRAAALGQSANAEAYINPIVGKIAGQGSDAQRRFLDSTYNEFDQQLFNVENDFAQRPIEPPATDFFGKVGGGLFQLGSYKDYMKDLDGILGKYNISASSNATDSGMPAFDFEGNSRGNYGDPFGNPAAFLG